LRGILTEYAWATTHKKDSYYHAQYRRPAPRIRKKKALKKEIVSRFLQDQIALVAAGGCHEISPATRDMSLTAGAAQSQSP